MTVWDVVSNAFYIPAVVRAFQLRAIPEAVLLILITLASLAWHVCDTWHFCWGLSGSATGRIDWFVSMLSFLVLGLYLVGFELPQFKMAAYLGGAVLLFGLLAAHAGFTVQAVVVAAYLVILLLVRVAFYAYPARKLDVVDLSAAAVLIVAALLLFGLVNNQPAVHGFWHLLTGLSAYMVLEAVSRRWSLFCWKRRPAKSTPESGTATSGESKVVVNIGSYIPAY